jgi:hypothetical protein
VHARQGLCITSPHGVFSYGTLPVLIFVSFGSVRVEQMLKIDVFFFPHREILFENRIAVFRLLLSPCCSCAY